MSRGHRFEKEQHVSSYSLQCARECLQYARYGRAFAHFLLVLKLSPEKKADPEMHTLFSLALQCFAEELERADRIDDLFKCYQQSCEIFPECDSVFNDMGVRLFRLGYPEEAADCFRRVLQVNRNSLKAEENLENVHCHLVERWHFRMLNDARRNLAFKIAICTAVSAGYTSVLDIGTGTGLLSMFAVQAGAERVYGCEMSRTMYNLSCDVLSANHVRDRVTMVPKKSTEMCIPADMDERTSLIVTETFDAGLLGEHILSTLSHAHQHLLSTDLQSDTDQVTRKGRIIPAKADVFLCGVECESIHRENKLVHSRLCGLNCGNVAISCCTGLDEPYTSEKLNGMRSGYRELTERIKFTEIDFQNVKQYLGCGAAAWGHKSQVKVIQDGRLDAMVMWFDLHLDDQIKLSSSPDTEGCWEQAIYPVLPSHLPPQGKKDNLLIRSGDLMTVHGRIVDNAFSFRCIDISGADRNVKDNGLPDDVNNSSADELDNGGPNQSQNGFLDERAQDLDGLSAVNEKLTQSSISEYTGSTTGSERRRDEMAAADQTDEKTQSKETQPENDAWPYMNGSSNVVEETSQSEFVLKREELGKLNNVVYMEAYHTALSRIRDKSTSQAEFSLYDISDGFSPFILCAAKMGASCVRATCCKSCDQENCRLMAHLARMNGVSPEMLGLSEAEEQTADCDRQKWASVLVTDFVEPCGVIQQQICQNLSLARAIHMKPDAKVVPDRVAVYGMLIESEHLSRDSGVIDDGSMLGFKVAQFINVFQAKTHVDIDLFTLPHKKLCDPFHLFTFELNEACKDSERTDEILSCSNNQFIPATDCGTVTAAIYWFELTLIDDIKLCTLDKDSHWKQAGVIQRDRVYVAKDANVCVSARCEEGSIDIRVKLLQSTECS